MTRKLITLLGVGNYSPSRYSFGDRVSEVEEFVQVALIRLLAPDELVILLTHAARAGNYEAAGKLRDQLNRAGFAGVCKDVSIRDGGSEAEICDIFSAFRRELATNDTVIFDVTHAFRSIPIVALACIQYARAIARICLEGIYYGAFEAKRNSQDPEEAAPILDLTAFVELMDWSRAVVPRACAHPTSVCRPPGDSHHALLFPGRTGFQGYRPSNARQPMRTRLGSLRRPLGASGEPMARPG